MQRFPLESTASSNTLNVSREASLIQATQQQRIQERQQHTWLYRQRVQRRVSEQERLKRLEEEARIGRLPSSVQHLLYNQYRADESKEEDSALERAISSMEANQRWARSVLAAYSRQQTNQQTQTQQSADENEESRQIDTDDEQPQWSLLQSTSTMNQHNNSRQHLSSVASSSHQYADPRHSFHHLTQSKMSASERAHYQRKIIQQASEAERRQIVDRQSQQRARSRSSCRAKTLADTEADIISQTEITATDIQEERREDGENNKQQLHNNNDDDSDQSSRQQAQTDSLSSVAMNTDHRRPLPPVSEIQAYITSRLSRLGVSISALCVCPSIDADADMNSMSKDHSVDCIFYRREREYFTALSRIVGILENAQQHIEN